MTAPLTPPPPPHRRSSQSSGSSGSSGSGQARQPGPVSPWQSWQVPPAGVRPVSAYEKDGPGRAAEIREAVVVMVAVALCGVPLGLLWLRLAPRVPLIANVSGSNWVVYLKDTEGEQAIGVDGTFTLLALAFGVLSAVVVFLVRRRGGVPLVVALCVGGLLGSLLAWRLGVWLGPEQDVIAHAKAVGKGVTFPAPLKLEAQGALLAWSLAALIVHLGLTALFGPRDPETYGDGAHGDGAHGNGAHGESSAP
ncbi:AAA family ATPase [Streptomyces sp. NPDC001292]|uniref:AAA family ATPase n=1 Tax=Streptomyces sp. NPDC001292 TaxID=3364558 RepID=UPI0036BAA6AF